MEKKTLTKIKVRESYDDLIRFVMNRNSEKPPLEQFGFSGKLTQGRPGRYRIDVLDKIPDDHILKKINLICDQIKEQEFVSMSEFSRLSNVSYSLVWRCCNIDDPPLPYKRETNKKSTSSKWIGDHKQVKEWLINHGKRFVAGSIIRDQKQKKVERNVIF